MISLVSRRRQEEKGRTVYNAVILKQCMLALNSYLLMINVKNASLIYVYTPEVRLIKT